MTDATKTLIVHAACVAVIAACFWIAGTALHGQPMLAGLVIGVGAWLWGKLGFKPAQVIFERIVAKQLGVPFDDVRALTTRPPAAAAHVDPDEEVTQ